MHSSQPFRIAVVGGGVSGLSTAYHLHKHAPDSEITLFESSPRLGGVIRTCRKNGFLIESAADNFITANSSIIELCDELGLSQELVCTNPRGNGAMVLSRGTLEPIPPGFMVMAPSRIWPLLATRILSPSGKLRSACEVLIPRRRAQEDESLESFVTRRFGKELFERLVQPLVGGIYTADPARLSVSATMPRFQEMERKHGSLIRGMLQNRSKNQAESETPGGARYSQFMSLQGGMSRLIDGLAASLPEGTIRLNHSIARIEKDRQGWLLYDDRNQIVPADALVVAAPAHQASYMLQTLDEKMAEELGRIEYASCAIVSLAFKKSQLRTPLSSFGFVVPRIEKHYILSCSFSSEKYPGRAPEDTVLMRIFIGGALQPGLLQLPNAELIELARMEVAELLSIDGAPILQHVVRQRHAMPQYHVGHKQRIARIEDRLRRFPTLALAGSSMSGVGIPGCIESGANAARRILAACSDSYSNATPLESCEAL